MDVNAKAVGAVALPFVGGFAATPIQKKAMDGFYNQLKKPWFTPPPIAFPIVWSSLYASMGYASYLVYRDGGGFEGAAKYPLMLYGVKMAVNWSFTPIFFGMKKLGLGAINCGVLAVLVAATMKSFYDINPTAGALLIPYQVWTAFATIVATWVWKNNPEGAVEKSE